MSELARKFLDGGGAMHYLLILLASVLVVSPVLLYGIPYGNSDLAHHLQIASAFYESLQQGVFYPGWVFHENSGYGAVTVRFYPPLMNYSLAVFRMLTGSWQTAIFLAFAFYSFVGGLGVYVWTRDFFEKDWQALIAAGLYISAPYHLNEFYNSFMYGEFAALSVLPFCFYFARKACERERATDITGLSVSAALLILSNLPQTVIGVLCIGFYVALNLKKSVLPGQIFRLVCAGLLALALSAFYWVRLVAEMHLLVISQPNTDPYYDYRNHFLLSNFSFDNQGVWFASLMFVVSILITAIALIVSGKISSLRQNKSVKHIFLLNAVSIFLILPVSKFVWDNFSFLQKVQFPWRFLSIMTLCTSVILAYCTEFINIENLRKKRPLILLLVGVLFIFLTFSIKQVIFGAAFLESSKFEDTVAQSVSQKGLKHWMPVWAEKQNFKEKTQVLAGGREVSIKAWEPEKRVFTVAAGERTNARLAILYYPHWQAFVDGRRAEVSAGVDGEINLEVPETDSIIELVFVEPPYIRISGIVSVIAWAAALMLVFYQIALNRKKGTI